MCIRDRGAAALLPVPEAVLAAQHKEEFMKGLQAALAQPTADRHRLLMQALRGVFRAAKPA